ncbi:hypothetical protein GCM10025760_16800 [Microbacterium yannicii]|uniref:Restriction endonuclease type IV Mrr domain-containing protein n=2 Tax=Microbacterium yannicii TaxID=671622 RepID=A0ABP9M432_9MICO|nr:hypothetical protein [Microbacterium yannicii]MCO5955113.1 hypothetical protein [Microbacterium yannicii]
MLEWTKLGEDEFNRVAEQLIMRTVEGDNPGLVVTAVDGRGGDGGIDLDVTVKRTGQLVAIYQLKYFPEGFSGAHGQVRKPQIQRSFNAALEHDPPVWYLVVPRNLTPGERKYVRELRGEQIRPQTRYIGGLQLDKMLARYPDVEDWAERSPMRTALDRIGRPSAALSEPDDLRTEISQTLGAVQARSPYWGVNINASTLGHYIEEYVALRPDSAVREPLSLTLSTNFASHVDVGEAYRRAMEYGITKPLRLPASVVTRLELNGPEWFANVFASVNVELHPAGQEVDVATKLVLLSDGGAQILQRKSQSTTIGRGTRGGQFLLDFGDGLEMTLVMTTGSTHGAMTLTAEFAGQTGTAAVRAFKFVAALERAAKLRLHYGELEVTIVLEGERPHVDEVFVELAEDLAFIENETGVEFAYPEELPEPTDRVNIRIARRLFEGEVSIMPKTKGGSITLDGTYDENLVRLLQGQGWFGGEYDDFTMEILGEEVAVDGVWFAIPDAVAEDAETHVAALKAGTAANRTVELVPADGVSGVYLWSRPRRREPDQPLVPKPWDLTGILEHRQLREK